MVIQHYKGEPNTYVIRYRADHAVKHGRELATICHH